MMPVDRPDGHGLAAALRELREEAGLSVERLAEMLGYSPTKVSRLEDGRTIPRPPEAAAWAAAVGRPDRGHELAELAAELAAHKGTTFYIPSPEK